MDTLFPTNFSPSMLEDLHRCPFYFFRKHCQRLKSDRETNPDLTAGRIIAKSLELTRVAYFNDKLSIEESIELGQEYILDQENITHEVKTIENLALVVRRYWKIFPLESDFAPVMLPNGKSSVEYRFEIDLNIPHPEIENTNLKFVGVLDGLYRFPIVNSEDLYIVDEKSTGRLPRIEGTKQVDTVKITQSYTLSGQPIAYHWAMRQMGLKTKASIIRKIPILKEHEPAFGVTVPVNDFILNAWETATITKIIDVLRRYADFKNHFCSERVAFPPVYGVNCETYNRMCDFAIGCTDKNGEALLLQNFSQKVYDATHEKSVSLETFKKGLKLTL